LLNQIAIANESLRGGTIVVMAERDKEEMEADIAKMEFDMKGTAVICRSGSPLILADLKKVNTCIETYFFSVLNFDLLRPVVVY
jgi:ion channel POLLUX/CASTOR